MLGSLWLMSVRSEATLTKASDNGTCTRADFATLLTMKFHFACLQSGSRLERYTNTELADIHLPYEVTDCNGRAAQRLYAQRNPRRQTPNCVFRARLLHRLSDSESFIVDTQGLESRERKPNNVKLCWIW
ncbi:DUF4817 domain-containing protein [Trichonephila clavipes]|nr:DUF4817 domain-containing protein [Trichonephila clavipes]